MKSSKYNVRVLVEKEFESWDRLVSESQQGTLFHKTCRLEGSDRPFKILGCLEANDQIIGGIPVTYRRRFGLIIVSPPPLTPYLGAVFRKDSSKYVSQISKEKHSARSLVEKIKEIAHFAYIPLGFSCVDLQPFIWEGFWSSVRYTYLLELDDLDEVWKGMDFQRRNNIVGAKRDGVYTERSNDFGQTLALVEKTFERQKKKPADKSFALKHNKVLCRGGQCISFTARNKDGRAIAVAYIVWDEKRSYCALGGHDAVAGHHGAGALAMWEAIKFTKEELGLYQFDFEGSMIQPIEQFFRGFGGRLTPCYTAIWYQPYIEPLWLGYRLVRNRGNW